LSTAAAKATRRPRIEGTPSSTGLDILARLRADIVSNTFEPEAKLKFAELTRKYDVGVGTLREALSHLVSEGFVMLDAGRGYRVAPVSVEDLTDIVDHYTDFEKRALADAIKHGDDAWEANIVATYHRLNIIHSQPWEIRMARHNEWVERHKEFHAALVSACQSRWVLKLRALMFNQVERYRFLSKINRKTDNSKGAEHRDIMKATLARDTALALELMERHIRETADNVLSHLPDNACQ
jgi:GntR family carbon starvation induced transcriptional regulator